MPKIWTDFLEWFGETASIAQTDGCEHTSQGPAQTDGCEHTSQGPENICKKSFTRYYFNFRKL